MGGFLKNFFVYLSISNCLHIHFIPSQNISSILFLFLYIYDIQFTKENKILQQPGTLKIYVPRRKQKNKKES